MTHAPHHHYRTRRASAIELLKEDQQEAVSNDSSASDYSRNASSSPQSTASTASTSRDIHLEQSGRSRSGSGSPPKQLAKARPDQQQKPGMATMTDGPPRHYPHHHHHHHLPPLSLHGQQQLQHPRHSVISSLHSGSRSEYGDIPGSPAPIIHRPASAAAQLNYTTDPRSSNSISFPGNDKSSGRNVTSAPSGAATPRAGVFQDAPRTPASPGHMSAGSTGSTTTSLKRGWSRDVVEQQQGSSVPSSHPLAPGPDLRSRRKETSRLQEQQELGLYTNTNNNTTTTTPHSELGGPNSASSAGSGDGALGSGYIDASNIPGPTFPGSGSNAPGGNPGGRELICLCTRAPKVPRPRNAFILYRQHYQATVASNNPGLANPEISKLIGEQWRAQPEDVKDNWKRLAEEEKIRHQQQYPDYRYQPRRGGKSGAAHGSGNRPLSSGGDDPGRCNKCGGRYIATPRTPSTPFTPVSAEPGPASGSGGPGSGGSSYGPSSYYSQHPRGIESGHLRHGSASSISSGDTQGRRYNTHGQYSLANIDEDYAARQQHQLSPGLMASPEAKRRRYDNGSSYPMSPPVGGNYTHADPRYQQYQGWPPANSPAGPPPTGGALTYGTAQIPRGELPPQESYPMPGVQQQPYHHAQGNQQGLTRSQQQHALSSAQMPQPTTQGDQQQHHQRTQHGSQLGAPFDESLRLPPLQSQMPQPSEGQTSHERTILERRYHDGQQVSQGRRHPAVPDPSQQQYGSWPSLQQRETFQGQTQAWRPEQREPDSYFPQDRSLEPYQQVRSSDDSSRWQFLQKLEALRSIQPPLSTQQSRSFETRGPVIAVEGSDTRALRGVARVIEKALIDTQDCAVRAWTDETLSTVEDEDSAGSGRPGGQDPHRTQPTLAKYMAKMLRWHQTSEDLVDFITHHPPKQENGQNVSSKAVDPSKMPVAIVSAGYSLTVSDRWAAALQHPGVTDAYSGEDHWRWIATLWRGIVGADLTIYVREQDDVTAGPSSGGAGLENNGSSGVELLTASAISATNNGGSPVDSNGGARSASGGEDACIMVVTMEKSRGMDEKLERRLGFEIMEWVRGGGFSAAATLRQLSSTVLAGAS